MPLIKSSSKAAVGENIRREMDAGKPQKQAVAIALDIQRRAGKAEGGASIPDVKPLEITPAIRARMQARAANAVDDNALRSVVRDAARYGVDWSHLLNRRQGGNVPRMADGGIPWVARLGARNLAHEGMLKSPVPGRTDRLPINVKGGSYVLPADHVAALGENNSAAGANILNKMFKMGPYGTTQTPLKAGMRPLMPHLGMRAPRMPKAAGGGAHVPIVAAGGEFVIPPEKVAEIGNGDVDRGHKILDHWVMTTRKKHINTLRNLKPPKKN